jgi:hypothetical protein
VKPEEVGNLLKNAAVSLREVTQQRDEALTKLAEKEKRNRAEKIASTMVSRGYLSETDHSEKVEELSASEELDVIEKALDLASAPEEVAKLATVGMRPAGNGLSQFEQFVLSHGSVVDVATDFSSVS